MGYKCCILQKLLDGEIFSDSYQIIEIDVGTYWIIVIEEVFQCTPSNLVVVFLLS